MKYEINGHIIEAEAELSEAEIDEIAASFGPATQEASTPNPLMQKVSGMADKAMNALSAVGPAAPVMGDIAQGIQGARALLGGSQLSQKAGEEVAEGLGKAGVPAPLSAGAGFVTQMATDPLTLLGGVGGKAAGKAGAEALIQGGKKVLPGVMKTLANVPEVATETMLKDAQLLAKNTGSEAAIEQGVGFLQSALKDARKTAGKRLGALKEIIGINTSFEDGIFKLANTAQKPPKGAEQLAQEYLALKATRSMMKSPEKLKALVELRQQIDDAVRFSSQAVAPVSSKVEGLLKTAAQDINQMIEATPKGKFLRSMEKKFSETAGVYDDLQQRLADPGQAEGVLRNLFLGKNPANKDVLASIRELEKISKKPLLAPLFQEFAKREMNRVVGRPGIMGAITGFSAGGAIANPLALLGVPVAFAAQSPRVLSAGVRAAKAATPAIRKSAGVVGGVVGAGAGATLGKIREFLQKGI